MTSMIDFLVGETPGWGWEELVDFLDESGHVWLQPRTDPQGTLLLHGLIHSSKGRMVEFIIYWNFIIPVIPIQWFHNWITLFFSPSFQFHHKGQRDVFHDSPTESNRLEDHDQGSLWRQRTWQGMPLTFPRQGTHARAHLLSIESEMCLFRWESGDSSMTPHVSSSIRRKRIGKREWWMTWVSVG